MKRNKLLPTSLLLLALIAVGILAAGRNRVDAAESATGATWLTDFDAAKATAKAEGKPVLLDFTGSDWCVWCIRLDKEVFTREAFVAYADASLVLVELDFPQRKEQPKELT
jgi:protein disulfide-isomerase